MNLVTPIFGSASCCRAVRGVSARGVEAFVFRERRGVPVVERHGASLEGGLRLFDRGFLDLSTHNRHNSHRMLMKCI